MTYLTPYLPFPTPGEASASGSKPQHQHATALPPPKSHLVISDTLLSPGHFAIYHLIASAIARKRKVVWVDFRSESRASLEATLRKMSVILPSSPSDFTHISPSSLPAFMVSSSTSPSLYDEDDQPTLRGTYDACKGAIHNDSVIILDGLSELLYMGFSLTSVWRFVRAIHMLSLRSSAVLVSALHTSELGSRSSAEHDLLEKILHIGTCWWRIDGLSSGRSGDVHGEISSFPLVGAGSGWPSVTKAQPLQYRLEASTVKVFPKGTGRGFL